MHSEKIGIFDSGVGGLAILKELLMRIPWANYLYIADTAHLPFGQREPEEIFTIASGLTRWLVHEGCNAVVMACNLSSAFALREMRKTYLIPIFGVLQGGIRAAWRVSRTKHIGVLTTPAMKRAEVFPRIFQNSPYGLTLVDCPEWVPLIEQDEAEEPRSREAFARPVHLLKEAGVDVILPACTHYLHILPLLRDLAGEGITLVDPAVEAVREVEMVFPMRNHYQPGTLEFRLTAESSTFSRIAQRVLGKEITVQRVEIPI